MSLEILQNGRYQLLRLIGQGAMGNVYLAQDTRIDRQIAIKIINPYHKDEATNDAIRLFHREAQTIAKLNHPHILPLFDFDEASSDGSTPTYMVMPFCPEGSLAEWLRQHNDQGLLASQDVVQLVHQAASALQYAHDHGIIHRDVKPANFLIRSNRDNPSSPDLLLADFGVAKLSAVSTMSSQSIRGTPSYMSPEQWSGAPVPATDQYALAVMAYELLTGRAPFRGDPNQVMYSHVMVQPQPPSTINPRLPAAVDAVILRALAKNPAERFSSISDFSRALQQALFPDRSQLPAANSLTYTSPVASSQPPMNSNAPFRTPASLPPLSTTIPNAIKQEAVMTKPRGFFTSRNLLLLGLALLVILAVAGISLNFLLQHSSGPVHTPNGTNPGNTPSTASATTPISQVANPYSPHTGTLVLSDPLHDNSKGYMWDITNIAGGGSCSFTNNTYVITQDSILGGITGCNPESLSPLSNFTLQVQVTIVNGDAGGITFRVTHSNFYLFAIAPDDTYHVDVVNGTSLPTVIRQGTSSAIHKGLNQSNLIAIVAIGDKITLYVNNQLIGALTDNTYTSGQIGLAAEESSSATNVMFNNAMVWKM